jgi:RNA polymerase-interacting CarD/CdnL/TRCF family regulator
MKTEDFEIGDVLVHRTQGIGVIARTCEVTFAGETTECFIVEPILADPSFGRHIVAIDGIQKRGFRPILSRTQIDQALVDARSLPINTLGPNYSAWYWTVVTLARSNDFAERVQAIRDIRQGKLQVSDAMTDVLERTTRAVTWEIRVANSCDTNEATRMLETALD